MTPTWPFEAFKGISVCHPRCDIAKTKGSTALFCKKQTIKYCFNVFSHQDKQGGVHYYQEVKVPPAVFLHVDS